MVDLRIATTAGADTTLKETAVEEFKASLRGELLQPGDVGYDEARTIWNAMIDKKPGLIVRCAGVADVINSVNLARANNLLVAVRGGGHNVAGNAVCEGGVMIDLSPMKSVRVDPVKCTAHAEPGLTWGEFDHETQVFGLATTGGAISTTGIAGVTLGGGWGWLSRLHGLASDNLLSVDVVTADGRFLTANATENADLFWGLRGGGGNFGVVTSFEYKLHPVGPMVLGGMVVHPFERAKEVLQFYRDFSGSAPDELTSWAVLLTSPQGDPVPVVIIAVCYSGTVEEGERVLQPLREFGPPLAYQVGPMSYTDLQQMGDVLNPPGLQDYWKGSFLKELSDDAIDALIGGCTNFPTPLAIGLIEHTLGGAVSRAGQETTAFNHRDVEYSFLSLAGWPEPAESEKCIRWVRELWEAMQPFTTEDVYVNYLGEEGEDRVKAAYGPEKYQRLVALKNKYDPTNLFRLNQNIKPTG